MTPIIDTCSFIPTPETLRQWFAIISKSSGYLRVFWRGFAHWAGLSKTEYFAVLDGRAPAEAIAYLAERIATVRAVRAEQFIAQLDEANIRASVIHNYDCETYLGVKPLPFEYHAELLRRFPGRLIALAGIDPAKGPRAVTMLEECLGPLGYSGLVVTPFRNGAAADHEMFKPLYRLCQERGAPVWIHSTNNWDPKFPFDLSSPQVIDRIAIEFPELKIMAGHAGWPRLLEMITVVWRHPNVVLEVSAFRPRNMAEPGFGFEPLLQFGTGPLQDKVLFGSTWNLLNLPMADIFREVRELPRVTEAVADKWLHHNAARFFGLA